MPSYKNCGHCRMSVPKQASVCGHCGAEFVKYRDTSVVGRIFGAGVGAVIAGIGCFMFFNEGMGILGAIVGGGIGFFIGSVEERSVR